ncbi:unnamed protein product, partial [Scytosiphon promiscuus]
TLVTTLRDTWISTTTRTRSERICRLPAQHLSLSSYTAEATAFGDNTEASSTAGRLRGDTPRGLTGSLLPPSSVGGISLSRCRPRRVFLS